MRSFQLDAEVPVFVISTLATPVGCVFWPRIHALRQSGRNRFVWEAINTNLRASGSILSSQISNLISSMRKYCINTPFRISSFLGNAIQETGWLSPLHEVNGSNLWYAPWYARGFL